MDRITIERIYIPSVEQSNALNAAADKEVTRDIMAGFYADCLIAVRLSGDLKSIDWKALNEAITARWKKGLVYIKTRAWNLAAQPQRTT